MSDCRWCDNCESPYPTTDNDARRIQIEEPVMEGNIRRGSVTIERDQCGKCMRAQRRAQEERKREIRTAEIRAAATVAHLDH